MPTPHKFFVGFVPPTVSVQQFTNAMAERLPVLRAVTLFNEKQLGCKFAWMAVAEASDLPAAAALSGDTLGGLVPDGLVVRADGVGADWDETRPEFRQQGYLLLKLRQPDQPELQLSGGEIEFLLKDPVGGAVVERKFRSVLADAPAADGANQALVWSAVLPELLHGESVPPVCADSSQVAEALRFCDVRRRVDLERRRRAEELSKEREATAQPAPDTEELREPPATRTDIREEPDPSCP
eukprot:TRINITY_DN1535_c0_g3_i1.p1 TRINITY_DN1535_c0_g3~~TRINITY_DN1535_c0_g3_i1.p1  ORF type:complete len:262 (+),score=96.51 TRINITY_DN1535_c0_g3_i1:67-786(+)